MTRGRFGGGGSYPGYVDEEGDVAHGGEGR